MKTARKLSLTVGALAFTMAFASGCGPKTPDASDPSVKQNAMKEKPQPMGGGNVAGGGATRSGGDASGAAAGTRE